VSPIAFLLIALAGTTLGIVVAVLRHRTPRSHGSGIDSFTREMQALAPRQPPAPRPGPGPDPGER